MGKSLGELFGPGRLGAWPPLAARKAAAGARRKETCSGARKKASGKAAAGAQPNKKTCLGARKKAPGEAAAGARAPATCKPIRGRPKHTGCLQESQAQHEQTHKSSTERDTCVRCQWYRGAFKEFPWLQLPGNKSGGQWRLGCVACAAHHHTKLAAAGAKGRYSAISPRCSSFARFMWRGFKQPAAYSKDLEAARPMEPEPQSGDSGLSTVGPAERFSEHQAAQA